MPGFGTTDDDVFNQQPTSPIFAISTAVVLLFLRHFFTTPCAAIDVFSRYVLWTFVGISGRSQTSVFAQYCEAVRAHSVIPKLLRADRGAETVMAADAHARLSREVRQGGDGEPLEFEDCFRYGTSKQNQWIEAWWAQQSRSQTARWRDYFAELSHTGRYSPTSLADRIAFAMIYIPIIRMELDEYVRVWNNHHIRNQPERPYLKTGKPYTLYHWPTVRQQGVQSGFGVPPELLDQLEQYAGDFGLLSMRVEAFAFGIMKPPKMPKTAQQSRITLV